MSDIKQVKVDNWGIYFLQRLKHFFNRTDYCDLTLQFQDNAQLRVHRLVLSACTEYFELLERTCEMYEDCLVMPDDLQADVVVPIVNFMYTGQLEFQMNMLEKLYQTSLVMNMPVLSKLLDAHRSRSSGKSLSAHSYSNSRRDNRIESVRQSRHTPSPSSRMSSAGVKRSYSNAFQNASSAKQKVKSNPVQVDPIISPSGSKSPLRAPSPLEVIQNNKRKLREPRPTRYELPEELDTDNIFENSFSNISYTSAPLMVHPDTSKHYPSKKDSLLHKKLTKTTTMEIVECKKIKSDNIFEDDVADNIVSDESDMFHNSLLNDTPKDPNQLFDQILDANDSSKVVIETKGGKQSSNIDHAKIISEVLKKYPHLVKSNKNIKLKILNSPSPSKGKKEKREFSNFIEAKEVKPEPPDRDYTYETDVIDSKEAAKLIAMGAENIKGPWICLICGTPGRALHFTSYYKFRRHLVEVHNEKCVPTICEYCGFKSFKRNYMVHHCYTKHGVKPPPQYHFPKCNQCDYVAITEGFLVKHKLAQHNVDNKPFRCHVCLQSYHTSNQLLVHVQKTGHKFGDKKQNQQCIYCLKVFLREANLYAHLKTNHKVASKRDGILDDSDEEKEKPNVKREEISYDDESEDGDIHYQIQQRGDGFHVVTKKPNTPSSTTYNKQKILNAGFSKPAAKQQPQKAKPARVTQTIHTEFMQDEVVPSQPTVINNENIILIDDVEYVMKDNNLIPRKSRKEYIIPEIMDADHQIQTMTPSTSMQYANIQGTENVQQAKMIIKKPNMNQPIQIVVSNEEEYKALMSSNHSIIFDDGDTNKTLTMMSAPHNTTLDTTGIDLENAQSNDMMIIQDDYPLNVSEAVATDNNIVVVYSHPVGQINDDSNKQYQILTSQGIGAQFIQSSAMITQNYETVTTSTPVMSAHVIDAQVHESWDSNGQSNIQNQQMHITSDAQLQSITQDKDSNESLIELPEVQITAISKEIPSTATEDTDPNQSSIMNVEELPQNNSDQISDNDQTTAEISITPMDTDVPCSITSNNEIVSTEITDVIVATDEMDITPLPENNLMHEQPTDQPIPTTNIENHEEHIENQETVESQVENDNDENCEQAVEHLTETQTELNDNVAENVSEEEQVNDNVEQNCADSIKPAAVVEVAKEQIQTLTSEWSDDEYEAEDSNVLKETIRTEEVPEDISQVMGESHEMEESIENIQQEVEQMTTTIQNQEMESTLNDNISSDLQESTATTALQNPVPEKLSSLLNDWEDNDSQEENATIQNESENVDAGVPEKGSETTAKDTEKNAVSGTQEENGDQIENDSDLISIPSNIVADKIVEEATNESVVKKDDKIKSLVSDWDDDEEENKE